MTEVIMDTANTMQAESRSSLKATLIDQPVFLVGAERSGTTLLRLMLDHHPDIAFNSEFEYVVDCVDGGILPDMQTFREFLETDRIFLSSGYHLTPAMDYVEQVNDFLRQKQGDKAIVGATVHRKFDELLSIWPNAKFIHIIRDPRDVARSCIGMNWAGNVWTGVERWLEAETTWNRMVRQLKPENVIEIHFESLLSEPFQNLQRLCKFMGTEYDPAMMSYPQHSSYGLPQAKMAVQWRRKLSAREIRLVEGRVASLLTDRGYQLSELSPMTIKGAHATWLKVHDYFAVVAKRINAYGLPLVVASFVVNRMPLKSLRKHVRHRFNAVDTMMLK